MGRTSTAVVTVLHKGVITTINTPHSFVIRLYHRCISKYSHGTALSLVSPSSSPAPRTAQFLLLPYGRTPIQQNTPGAEVTPLRSLSSSRSQTPPPRNVVSMIACSRHSAKTSTLDISCLRFWDLLLLRYCSLVLLSFVAADLITRIAKLWRDNSRLSLLLS